MLNTYRNALGQTVALDASGKWRIFHTSTGSFGVFAAAPTPEGLAHPIPVQHAAATVATPQNQPGNRDQRLQQPPTGQERAPLMTPFQFVMSGIGALALIALVVFAWTYSPKTQTANTTPPPAVNQQTAPASTTGPLFELGGTKPGANAMQVANSQGYTWKKGVPGQDGCPLTAGRCPNQWGKK